MNKKFFLMLVFSYTNIFKLLASKKQEDVFFKESESVLTQIRELLEESLENIKEKKTSENVRMFQIKHTEQFEEDQKKIIIIKEKNGKEIENLTKKIKELTQTKSQKEIKDYNIRITRLNKQIDLIQNETAQRIDLINLLYKNQTSTYETIENKTQNMIEIANSSVKKINNYNNTNYNRKQATVILKQKTLARFEEIKNIINKIKNIQNKVLMDNRYDYDQILYKIDQITNQIQ